ncbi:CHRD domain-containing protein [Tellurirhabdus bombi]|uniref:CHRD domain-containing protein n=1 Tax=Tellurirhabdus bombi TaxID=2907205 RepID=UPI001F176AC8|nr:CHRD domain-containing protein [Tellurirhabdus bombi]
MKKRFAFFLPALLASTLMLSSCTNDDAPDKRENVEFEATINSSQTIPRTTTPGTGTFAGSYNKNSKTLTYTVTYSGLTPARGGLYSMADLTTQVGPRQVPFNTVATSPIQGTVRLSQQQENYLFDNQMYVNLTTGPENAPTGAIRGNIRAKTY